MILLSQLYTAHNPSSFYTTKESTKVLCPSFGTLSFVTVFGIDKAIQLHPFSLRISRTLV